MNAHAQNRNLLKRAQPVAVIILFIGFLSGCSFFGEQAPLEDGLFLSYDFAGSIIRVTFSEIDTDKFYATLTFGTDEKSFSNQASAKNRKIVNKKLKTERGTVYEAGSLGPIWIPSSSVKKGGNAHGDPIREVKEWNGWEVGMVKASFGRGALRGEWYYDKDTGFLVGGMRASVMDAEDGGTFFILDDSNLDSLF